MAAQQPSYAHPGPGPSSYYAPPHFAYPGPYQYQYPIPPINGGHPPSSPRVNPQGRGYPPSRGGPGYQDFQPHPHHYSYPQPSPHSPGPGYPAHPHGKFHSSPVAFSPNYPLHPSSPYLTPWQPQQPLSPLPKQLSMPPPLSSHASESSPDLTSTPESDLVPDHPPSPPRSPHDSPVAAPASPASSSGSSPKVMASAHLEYVIWSHRPSNPSSAPGVIISPRAHPPDDVIQKALCLPSPPPSPPPTEVLDRASTPTPVDPPSSTNTETTPATSTAPDTSVPTSPVSTNTSISVDESVGKALSLPEELPPPDRVATPQPDAAPAATEHSAEPDQPAQEPPTSPAPAKPAAPKPSWASLFRNDAASPTKPNSLPTSSVLGFSVPASTTASTVTPVSPSKKPELLSLLTSSPSSPLVMRIRPRGLVNTGNMCFANAVLQVLVYCPQFWRLFHELGKFLDTPADGDVSNSKTPLVVATIRFLKEFISKTKPAPEGKGKGVDRAHNGYSDEGEDLIDYFIPTYVYDALKEKKRFDHMRGGHQEDAEEFLGFYLDTLEEELLSISSSLTSKTEGPSSPEQNGHVVQEDGPWLEVGKRNRTSVTRAAKSTESPITRMFGGKFRSTLRVPHQKDSVLVEDWRSLRLDVQRDQVHTIRDALAYISSPQAVQVTSVTRPGATLDGTQTVQIEVLPTILILHLKRFLYDASAGVAKVGKQVSFAPELDVPPEVMVPGKNLHGTRYKLFGVLYHHGLSASGGHYTLDVLHPNIDDVTDAGPTVKPREGWIRIDDELVSDVRPEVVFGTPERDDRCAYLLFYRRVATGRS